MHRPSNPGRKNRDSCRRKTYFYIYFLIYCGKQTMLSITILFRFTQFHVFEALGLVLTPIQIVS